MPKFSEAQNERIADAAQRVAHQSDIVKRLESEAQLCKDNLKVAKTEMQFALNDLQAATQDALSGKEMLPNLFAQRNAKEK